MKLGTHTAIEEEEVYLGSDAASLQKKGAIHTAKEICQQPGLWLKTYHLVQKEQSDILQFLKEPFCKNELDIILTGAGTSAFIGKIMEGPFQANSHHATRAVATTDLLSHPHHYFSKTKTTLLISFGRSGNSPESVATVELANRYCQNIFHFVITCSAAGRLATMHNPNPAYILLLPEEACDEGLAMTGSFSSMLLAGLLVSRIQSDLNDLQGQVDRLCTYGTAIINRYWKKLRETASINFDRAVFLGSGPLQSTACESHLKMQELTDGKVICKFDSFLGFRHGPKVVINSQTLLVYLFSNDAHTYQYERDLVHDINEGEKGIYQIGISENALETDQYIDLPIHLSLGDDGLLEEFLAICSIVPIQILSFYKSLDNGLEPDNPSANGTITRIVEGVIIYEAQNIQV